MVRWAKNILQKTYEGVSNAYLSQLELTIDDFNDGTGTLGHERGGLEADISAYDGIIKVTGGATSELSLPAGDLVGTTATQTLTNKTLTAPVINTSATGTAIKDEDNMASDSATHLATQQSIKAYVDTHMADTTTHGTTGDIVGTSDTQTLSAKTLTSPVLNTSVSGTAVLDEDNMASDSDTQLATQQSIKAYVDTHAADTTTHGTTGDVVGTTDTQTLSAKTLTSPVINTSVSGTAILDEDNMASNSDTQLATQQSIKAYVDSSVAVENLWNRAATTISPNTANDNLDTGSGTITTTGTITGGTLTDGTFSVNAGTVSAGTWQGSVIDHERGGLEADVSAYAGLVHITGGTTSAKTIGIADDNIVEIDHASVADNDYAKFTANGLEGRSYTETKQDLSLDAVENTAVSTWAGSANITTLGTIATGTWEATDVAILHGGTGASDAATAFSNLKQAATTSATGVVELATTAEIDTATDTTRAITPDALAASYAGKKSCGLVLFGSGTAVTTGDGTEAITIPAMMDGMNLVNVVASVHTKGITGTTDIQVRRRRAGSDVDMLSTKVTIGDEFFAQDEVVNTSNDDVNTGDQIYIDVDAIHSGTAPNGLSVTLEFEQP